MKNILFLFLITTSFLFAQTQEVVNDKTTVELQKVQEVQRLGFLLKKENLKIINEKRSKVYYSGNAYSTFMRKIFEEALKEDFDIIKNKFPSKEKEKLPKR